MSHHRPGTAPARRRVGAVLALLVGLGTAAGCGSDPSAVYRDAAVSAMEGTLSEARTAELAGRLWVSGRSTHAFATVAVRESEAGVAADAAWFDEQDPPRRADDALRARTVRAIDEASSSVEAVRISLGRSDSRATKASLDRLRSACAQLESLAEELS